MHPVLTTYGGYVHDISGLCSKHMWIWLRVNQALSEYQKYPISELTSFSSLKMSPYSHTLNQITYFTSFLSPEP